MEKSAQDFMIVDVFIALSVVISFIWLLVKLISCLWNCLFEEAPREQYQCQNVYPITQPKYRRIIALDTEMVGAGARGSKNMLARVSMVDQDDCFYDKYVKPRFPVTDYRTPYSGVSPEDLLDAEDYSLVRMEVASIIEGCILVGHDLKNDLNILDLTHPSENTWDTAYCAAFRKMLLRDCIQKQRAQLLRLQEEALRRMWGNMSHYDPFEVALQTSKIMLPQVNKMMTEKAISEKILSEKPSLKRLTKVILGRDIQVAEHSSAEDAQAAFDLFFYLEYLKQGGLKFDS